MAALAEAFVRIRPDTSTFKSEAEKGVASAGAGIKRAADRHGKLFGTSFVKATAGPLRGIAGVVGGPVAAAFAVIGGAKLFSGFIAEGREAQKVGAQTAAVLKSTGGVAKISAAQVGNLATAISDKVGVDDEAIQSGENLLLTFTNIRNEAGKGNRIFDQATQVVTDMAAAMNQGEVTTSGLKTASIQVGKALQDPIKGVTALRKVGVSLTDQQTKQIKTMVESGNTLGAQKIILGELNKEFGGSAAAGTNAMQKLGVVFGNIKEQIGTALLPIIDGVASWLADRLPGAVKVASKWLATAKVGFQALVAAFQEGDVTSDGFIGVMERIGVAARAVFEYFKAAVLPRLIEFGVFLRDSVIPALVDFGGWLVRNRSWLIPLGVGILTIVAAVKTWIAVTKAFTIVQGILNIVLAANPVGIIILAVVGLVAALVTAYKTSDTFRRIVQTAFRAVQVAASAVWNWIKSNWPLLLGILLGPVGAAAALIIKNWDKIKAGASALWSGLKSIWQSGVRFVVGIFLGLVGAVINGAAKAFGWVPGLGGKLKNAAASFNKFRDDVNRSLSEVRDRKVSVTAELAAKAGGGRNIGFATGGPVYGAGTATSDSIPALLSNGEHVLTAREVKAMGGHAAVMAMRRDVVKGFAAGGPVGFDIDTRLSGLARFEKAIDAFNGRVDALAAKLFYASGLNRVTAFARSQAGKPYVWGSAGPGGYDCSGFVSALVNVAQGRSPYTRRFSTATLPAGLFAPGAGAFNIGWFVGNPGHVAATVNGVPMESRGGDGVVVGAGSRGASQGIFNHHGHLIGFARGGPVLPGDPPYDLLNPRGKHYRPGLLELLQRAKRFDSGGLLLPGLSLAYNGTGRPERVRTAAQERALDGPVDLSAKTIHAIGETMGQVVLRGLSAGNVAVGRTAGLYVRGG